MMMIPFRPVCEEAFWPVWLFCSSKMPHVSLLIWFWRVASFRALEHKLIKLRPCWVDMCPYCKSGTISCCPKSIFCRSVSFEACVGAWWVGCAASSCRCASTVFWWPWIMCVCVRVCVCVCVIHYSCILFLFI